MLPMVSESVADVWDDFDPKPTTHWQEVIAHTEETVRGSWRAKTTDMQALFDGRGWDRTSDPSRVKRVLSR